MKKIVLLITAICLTSETYGQKTSSSSVDEYECIYEYQMKNDKGSSDVTSTIFSNSFLTGVTTDSVNALAQIPIYGIGTFRIAVVVWRDYAINGQFALRHILRD